MRVPVLVGIIIILMLALGVEGNIMQNTLWLLEYPMDTSLTVTVDDMIEIHSPRLPLVPGNLGLSFQLEYDRRILRHIASHTPEREGVVGVDAFFKVVQTGETLVEIKIVDANGQLLETLSYRFLCVK